MTSKASKYVQRRGKKKAAESVTEGNTSIRPPIVAKPPPPNPGKRTRGGEEGDEGSSDNIVERIEERRKRTKGLLQRNIERTKGVRKKKVVCVFSLYYLLTQERWNTKTHCYC